MWNRIYSSVHHALSWLVKSSHLMFIIRFQPNDVSSPIDDLSSKNITYITYLEPNSVK